MESLISSLQHLGLSLKESKTYLYLLRKNRISGYELSRNAGIRPSKIYEPLNKLLTKGIISPIRSDQGLRYLALEPLEILERHQNPYKHNLEGLKRQLIKTRQNPDAFDPFLWQLSERDNILLKIREIIKKSRKVIYLAIWKEALQEVEELLRKAAKQGAQMVIVLCGDAKIDFGVV